MGETRDHSDDRNASAERTNGDYYLPAMPRPSAESGRVERFIRKFLRRRGGIREPFQNRGW